MQKASMSILDLNFCVNFQWFDICSDTRHNWHSCQNYNLTRIISVQQKSCQKDKYKTKDSNIMASILDTNKLINKTALYGVIIASHQYPFDRLFFTVIWIQMMIGIDKWLKNELLWYLTGCM